MKVLKKDNMQDGTNIQIEDWQENYNFMPYGNTLAAYARSKASHRGNWSPNANEVYRFDFTFNSEQETRKVFNELLQGDKMLSDFKQYLRNKEYADCI